MATISKLVLTHTGLGPFDQRTQTNLPINDGFTVYFSDVAGDLDGSQISRASAQPTQLTYRVGGSNTVTLDMTDLVERSYNSGAISKLIASGHLTASLGGAVNAVEGVTLLDRDQHDGSDLNGDENDQGIRIGGKEGVNNGFVDMFYDSSISGLRIVFHAPTNQVFEGNDPNDGGPDADDSDIYINTAEGYKLEGFQNDGDPETDYASGGEFRVYTGKGYVSNAQENEGTKGGSVHFNTGNGGDFGGSGGDFNIDLGTGHRDTGGRFSLEAGDSESESDGGGIYLSAGRGDGNGNQGGSIELVVGGGDNGATEGELIIDHLGNGVLHMVGGAVKSTGTDFTPNFYQGKEIVNVANAQNLTSVTVTVPVAGLVNGGSSIIVSLMFTGGVGGQFTVAQTPFVFEIDGANDQFTVSLDITNNGNATDIAIA